jgi:cytochrome c553
MPSSLRDENELRASDRMNAMRALAAASFIWVGAPALGETMAQRLPLCLACHGEKGSSETPEIPSLGGQPASYVLIQLYQFREKQRIAEPMNELTKDFTDEDLRTYSDEVAKLPPPKPPPDAEPAKFEQGRAAAQKHRCGFCHNPDLSGHDQIGRIGDQREDYLLKALRGYKSGERKGYDPAMNEVAQEISEDEIMAIAHYVAHFK